MKLEGHALTSQETHIDRLRPEDDMLLIKWEDFKTLTKSSFYLFGYVQDQWNHWNYIRKRQGQIVQEHTTKFRKMDIILGISPNKIYVLPNYLGGLHSTFRGQ